MTKINLTPEQKLKLGTANRILGLLEIMLDEEGFEIVLEGESFFFRTKDEKDVFRLVDRDMSPSIHMRDSVILLPRTTDGQEFVPIKLDGKDIR